MSMKNTIKRTLAIAVFASFLAACDVGLGSTASPSPTPTPSPPPTSEGTAAVPILLDLDADHVFSAGTAATGDGSSYYRFTTGTAGVYYFCPSWTSAYSFALFSDSRFSVQVSSSPTAEGDGPLGALSAETTYYLRLTNEGTTAGIRASGRIASAQTVLGTAFGEGSVDTPVNLSLEDEHTASLGVHIWNRTSYYAFTTDGNGDVTIDLGAFPSGLGGIAYDLGTDPTFQAFTASGLASNQDIDPGTLSSNTRYFLRITGHGVFDGRLSLPLIVTEYPTDNIVLPLGATAGTTAFTQGALTSSVQEIRYRVLFPDASGGNYCILWDDRFQGSGRYTADVMVTAYAKNGSQYFSQDSAYQTPRMVSVPAGERAIIIRVAPFYIGGSGSFGIKCVTPSTGGGIIHIE
jgi:hypothetical protein